MRGGVKGEGGGCKRRDLMEGGGREGVVKERMRKKGMVKKQKLKDNVVKKGWGRKGH